MTTPIQPYNIDFQTWCAQLAPNLSFLSVPNPLPVDQWREWASQLILNNGNLLGNIPTPDKTVYPKEEDWREWASRFISMVIHT